MSSMEVALIADPHVSMGVGSHSNLTLTATTAVTEAVMADLEQRRPELAIWMGDLTHEGTDEVRARLRALADRFTVPSLWMLGNHDVEHVSKRAFARQTLPCVFRQWFHAAGWEVLILDTVRDLSPDDSTGQWAEPDCQLLRHTAAASEGPMLVLAHHPMRPRYLKPEPFWDAVSPLQATGVYIGGHSHRDVHETERNWHLLDIDSCSRPPFGYHWLTLTPEQLTITPVPVDVPKVNIKAERAQDKPVFPLTVPAC